jgi:hypothetical protein
VHESLSAAPPSKDAAVAPPAEKRPPISTVANKNPQVEAGSLARYLQWDAQRQLSPAKQDALKKIGLEQLRVLDDHRVYDKLKARYRKKDIIQQEFKADRL